jgi:hypothetical protein
MEFGEGKSSFSSQEMEGIFQETFGPSLEELGFTYIGKARWVRETAAEFKQLFYLHPFRPGADYYPHCALSFDYVPRIEAGKIKIRREAKHARVHLVITGSALQPDLAIPRDRESARDRCLEVAEKMTPAIKQIFEKTRTTSDALEVFEERKVRDGSGFYNYPETALAYAYLLAKSGRVGEARVAFDKLMETQSTYFPTDIRDAFDSFLAAN